MKHFLLKYFKLPLLTLQVKAKFCGKKEERLLGGHLAVLLHLLVWKNLVLTSSLILKPHIQSFYYLLPLKDMLDLAIFSYFFH